MWLVNQKESERKIKNNKTIPPKMNKTTISVYLLIISSHVNGLNTPINRQRVTYIYIYI